MKAKIVEGTARVAVVSAPRSLRVEERAIRGPAANEVLVRVRECGICGSDITLWSGKHPTVKPPMVLGHEFYGTVEAAGAGAEAAPGSVVAVFPPVGCGTCHNCRAGYPHICSTMTFIGGQHQGGLSELVPVPVANVVAMTDGVPENRRVLVEPLAVGVHAANRGAVVAGEQALVIGAGPIGLFTALALRHLGAAGVLLADVADERLALARALGAGDTVNSAGVSLRDYVRDTIRPDGVDVAFDCAGLNTTAAEALAATRKGGRAVLVGLMKGEMPVDGVLLQRGERSLIGVQQYTRAEFRSAMAILAEGALPAEHELTRIYPLDDVEVAFADLAEGRLDVLKSVVRLA